MIRRAPLALLVLVAACSWVRPVTVAPPPAPAAFELKVEATEPAPPAGAAPAPAPGATTAPAAAAPVTGSAALPGAPADAAERVTTEAVWWSAFAEPALDAAIQECFRNNLILRDVRGLIYENMLDPALPQGWWYPLQIGLLTPAGLRQARANIPPAPATPIEYHSANVDLGLTYQVDLFGNLDAQRRVGLNIAEQQRQLTEARVQDLAARITQVWFDILEARALRDITSTQLAYNQELLELLRARFQQHLSPRLAVLQQEQLLLNLQAQLPLITARLGLLNSELRALLGRMPSPTDDLVPLDRRLPDLPPTPELGAPSQLVLGTPELRLAQLRAEEVEHRVNQHLSSWLPTLQLVASVGGTTIGGQDFTDATNERVIPLGQTFLPQYLVGVNLTWPIVDGRRITEAKQLPMQRQRRAIQYQLALQASVGRVQDAVLRENNQATSLRSLRAQVELGRRLLAEARRLFEQGQSDYLPVLTALGNLVELERAALQAQRLLLNHRVEVYRSLGGTWSYDVSKQRE